MPRYRTALRMAHDLTFPQRRKWSTTFFIEAASALEAADLVRAAWVAQLRPGAATSVFAYEVYATDLLPATSDYAVVPVAPGSQRGTFNQLGGVQKYLLKACIAVTLPVTGSRPSRKFWRFGLNEDDVVDGVSLGSVVTTNVANAWTAFVGALGAALVDPQGQAITGVSRLRLTTREFGRTAGADVPEPPPVG